MEVSLQQKRGEGILSRFEIPAWDSVLKRMAEMLLSGKHWDTDDSTQIEKEHFVGAHLVREGEVESGIKDFLFAREQLGGFRPCPTTCHSATLRQNKSEQSQ